MAPAPAASAADSSQLEQLALLGERLLLERSWTFWTKRSDDDWKADKFRSMYTIWSIKHMWQVLNNIPQSLVGKVSIFFMAKGLLPLWEARPDIFARGGCWSTVVTRRAWTTAMQELCLAVFGEAVFPTNAVQGITVLPINSQHCILKLWTTTPSPHVGRLLNGVFRGYDTRPPRFKPFR